MLANLLADVVVVRQGPFWGFGFVDMAIAIVIIAAVCGLVFVALRQFGVAIPGWVSQVVWIVIVAFVVVFAIRLIASM